VEGVDELRMEKKKCVVGLGGSLIHSPFGLCIAGC
jgi:hypothetical protein